MRRWIPWAAGGILVGVSAAALLWWGGLLPGQPQHRFDREVHAAARLREIDPALIKAVIWKESRFDPEARGSAGEIGLMQLRELAAVEWSTAEGVLDFEMGHLADPGTNILAGSWYLARLLRRYQHTDNPVPYALADYNAGRANVRRWIRAEGADTNSAVFLEQVDFPMTRRYVESVMQRRRRY